MAEQVEHRDACVVVAGAGDIGSRHLQALSALSVDSRVYVVDVDEGALARAESRWDEVATKLSPRVVYDTALTSVPPEIDVAVVATTADRRRSVIEQLLSQASVRYLVLEKVLFQRLEDYDAVRSCLIGEGTKAWVNLPRRMWPGYADAKGALASATRAHIDVSTVGVDLGCNAIHFIDLVALLVGSSDVTITDVQLVRGELPTRRPRFEPFTGYLEGVCSSSTFRIESQPAAGTGAISITGSSDLGQFAIEETAGGMTVEAAPGLALVSGQYEVVVQSRLTGRIVSDLLATGTCQLPTYEEACPEHEVMIEAFVRHLFPSQPLHSVACPIT